MSTAEIVATSADELARQIRTRERSPVEVVEACLERIDSHNPRLNCFCFVFADQALQQARAAEQAVMKGKPLGPAHGLPFGVKDVTATKGLRTTRGSYVYEHWVPDEDAVLVKRFRDAGAILLGKTTTPEFASDSFTTSPLWGITRNPWNSERTPGGSSGGSAAAVASGCLPWAEGTDMGGSVRIPAAFCGLVGLKPSLGRIPMDIIGTTFDDISHFGPLTRSIADAALFMQIAAGPDERDIQSLPQRTDFYPPPAADITGRKLALSMDLGYYAVDPEVEQAVRRAAEVLEKQGASVHEVNLGWSVDINDAWVATWGVYLEAVFMHGHDLDEWRDRMAPNVVDLIEQGRKLSAVAFKRFEMLRTEQWQKLARVFAEHDALLCPTTAHPAPGADRSDAEFQRRDPDGRFHGLDMTCPFNFVAQCPALSVPAGLSSDALPIGLQIVGRRFDDLGVLAIGAALEQAQPWPLLAPEQEQA